MLSSFSSLPLLLPPLLSLPLFPLPPSSAFSPPFYPLLHHHHDQILITEQLYERVIPNTVLS